MSEIGNDKKIRVVVADDQLLYRDALVNLIQLWPEFEVVGQASNGREAVLACAFQKPDLVLLDIQMPELDGISAARQIKEQLPDTPIIMLTVATDPPTVLDSLREDVRGYLLKDTPANLLHEKMLEALNGSIVISDIVNTTIVKEVNSHKRSTSVLSADEKKMADSLSTREREVLQLLADGKSNEEIATALYLSVSSVKKQVASIRRKLQADNRVQVVSKSYRMGLVE